MKTQLVPILIFSYMALMGCSSSPKDSEVAALHLNMGTSLLTSGNYRMAMRELLQAEKLDNKNPVIQSNLGLTYYMLEQPVQAEKHFRRAIEIEPKYSDAHNNLSRVLIDLNKLEESQIHARKVLEDLTYGQPEKAWINLGLSYFAQRNFRNALGSFKKAVHLDQQNCLAQTMLGRTEFEMNHFREAARVLDWGSKYCEASHFDEPLYYSGLAYYKAGEREKALARIDSLLRLYPNGKYAGQASSMRKLME